ncbi:Hook-filament junction protein [Clostridium sp. N3C]|uniref:flagellar hook-associated protein FlgL n=1 Tax=Clostridium sp. N3C TaxID=1776758 RepID=UPI00092DFF1C|nr:flagellar hook-associated protein FlgL [Clostridium sp. N3C]SCN21283.1 Hook-filament junction protein [Clostridium sp. N3C]
MRVTNKMLSTSFLRDMGNNLSNLQELQQQMTSGKEIRRPSDNPFKVARAMQLYSNINANKQYKENISDTINWLDTTDTALGQAGNVLQRVRELLISAGNASYSESERKAIKDEINEKIGELAQILNTNFDGKYIFGGTRATTKPVDSAPDANTNNTKLFYNSRSGSELELNSTDLNVQNELAMIKTKMSVEISQGVSMEYNVTAADVLQFTSEDGTQYNLMELLTNITNHLDGKDNNGNADTDKALELINTSDLKGITDAINNLLKIRSEVGAKQNRMESAKFRNEEETYNMKEILSETEDIDITEKTMEYAIMQTVYIASLQTSARVLQPTLMDYLG